ncbi:hypothetical protein [Lachnospira multipara]|uniref:Uncharacterized protein n=1 Tax=Lachnospira multipara TaxID=28051 RepID=A0A1H5TF21_9FIRM|nr:hypothetical protein [Lachnospira multipara]SEF60691.1 hypothetical protein SAMN05216537_104110 [Lachnospira multipara]
MREKLEAETIIKEFNRQVFESIVDYVIVGGYNEEENDDPSMITLFIESDSRIEKMLITLNPKDLMRPRRKPVLTVIPKRFARVVGREKINHNSGR